MIILLLFSVYILAMLLLLLAKGNRGLIEKISLAASVVECGLGAVIVTNVVAHEQYAINYFSVDSFAALLMGITFLLGLVATTYSVGYLRGEMAKKVMDVDRLWQCYVFVEPFPPSIMASLTTPTPVAMRIAAQSTTRATAVL